MKSIHFILIPLIGVAGCASLREHTGHSGAREIIRSQGEPECFQIKDGDTQMERAVLQARRTVSIFIAALRDPNRMQRDFEIKKPFVQGNEVEHIWLSNVKFSGNRFHGNVDNKPIRIKGLKMGDRVSVNPNEISDWAFVDHGKLVGGYTIRVLCNDCTTQRRRTFEKECNFRVGEQ